MEQLEKDKQYLLTILQNAYTNGTKGASVENIIKEMKKQLPKIIKSNK
ncbi:hypothetical protein [Gracilibacillus kekensis]|uniref:Uncharacterized protein n=1 Tax=Gracilibacillus kekensis TaxID=1027249 RepID=A0A1M7K5K5_9BACI|nr:hypothetical protein [Gracilibacillus kekensis]SHM60538.1 hypothetical protein SAMN05216179_0585 [Gracilibacillus kekensis]